MTLPADEFPGLRPDNHRETSAATTDYNCVAWAAEDTEHWWQPGVYWLPAGWPKDEVGLGALERAFIALGYESCDNGDQEPDVVKVALYGSGLEYTHAARRLPNGKWTSKLGKGVDIEHDTPDDVAGGIYGEVMGYMKRAVDASGPQG